MGLKPMGVGEVDKRAESDGEGERMDDWGTEEEEGTVSRSEIVGGPSSSGDRGEGYDRAPRPARGEALASALGRLDSRSDVKAPETSHAHSDASDMDSQKRSRGVRFRLTHHWAIDLLRH